MDFPKDVPPHLRFLMEMAVIVQRTKNRAEAESIEKIEPAPSPPDNAVDAAHRAINEIQHIFNYPTHLQEGEKVSFSITTSHTGSKGTKTYTYSAQLEQTAQGLQLTEK